MSKFKVVIQQNFNPPPIATEDRISNKLEVIMNREQYKIYLLIALLGILLVTFH